jgi:T1SS-143 domain-containing protein
MTVPVHSLLQAQVHSRTVAKRVRALTSEGFPVSVSVSGNDYVGMANGAEVFRLTLNSTTGKYDFTLKGTLDHGDITNPDDAIQLNFGVTATDADGDFDTGTIVVTVKDDGPGAHNDTNEFCATESNKDFNVALILDVSGSMAGDKLALLKASVANLLGDFNNYTGGEVKVHLVPFATSAQGAATFTITSDADYALALAFLNGLTADGFTNYEAPMTSAINWLQGNTANDPIAGADTYTYFVSDGEPNRYQNNSNTTTNGNAGEVMNQITGSDGSNEVALLQGLSTEVIAVGIGVSAITLGRLDIIDSNGDAIDVQDPNDLDAALQGTNPITGSADGNVISGLNGGAGAADYISKDADTTVTKVAFNGNVVNVHPVTGADIDGANGKLHINADGSYTYTLHGNAVAVNGIISDSFTYTLTDGDGDTSNATLSLHGDVNCGCDIGVDLKVNNGVDDVIVKEDGQVGVPVVANVLGGDGDEILTLVLTGVAANWVVTAPGWTNNGGGMFTLTLPAGQTAYSGSFTFKPPANSDVDLNGLNVKASVYDPDSASTDTVNDGFNVLVDAVIDPITFNATMTPSVHADGGKVFILTPDGQTQYSKVNIGNITHPDNDGSESLQKIVFKLPDAIDNNVSLVIKNGNSYTAVPKTTDATGTTYTVDLTGMTYAAAVTYITTNLYLSYSGSSYLDGYHNVGVTLFSYEKNLSGFENDFSDNVTSASKTMPLLFCISPLVVDLDGDGLELLSKENGVQFDMTQDGQNDLTGWVASDDALLALDKNQDGIINDRGELFGNTETHANGFAALADYDTNADGVINAQDGVFDALVVWKDGNSDGISQAGEMLSMDAAGLVQINLNPQAVDEVIAGNLVTETSSVVHADGSTTDVSDVWFAYDDTAAGVHGVTLEGSAGNDVLAGGAGSDTLYGGAGDDTFLYEQIQSGVDVIKDFELGHDVLDVSALLQGFDALQDSINDFVFSTDVGGNSVISVDADGSAGGASAVEIAVLTSVTGLDLSDILELTNNGQSTTNI